MAHEDHNLPEDFAAESMMDADIQCPAELAEDLAHLDAARVFVPAEVDQRIRSEARQYLAPIAAGHRRTARRPWWFAAGAGIGVAAALAVFVLPQINSNEPGMANFQGDIALESPALAPSQGALDTRDVDGSGQVDILDAYSLATQIEATDSPDPLFDINNDGQVNSKDVDDIAMAVVKLDDARHASRRVDLDLVPGG